MTRKGVRGRHGDSTTDAAAPEGDPTRRVRERREVKEEKMMVDPGMEGEKTWLQLQLQLVVASLTQALPRRPHLWILLQLEMDRLLCKNKSATTKSHGNQYLHYGNNMSTVTT